METKLPRYPVRVLSNRQYRPNDEHALLDVYIPNRALASQEALPAIVWTHGGAWLSGDKTDDAPYFERMADTGFVVVALNYALAPEAKYPAPLHELNDAYEYIQSRAASFHIDPHKIVLAGDSAGAQLTSQMAAALTNPAYAHEVKVQPALEPFQVAGVVLFCGIYRVGKLAEPSRSLAKIVDWGDELAVWAYTGERGSTGPAIRQMSTYYHVTKHFPPTFISGGNADALTKVQSMPFADRLRSLGVRVDTLFYPDNYAHRLPHEYQFTFDSDGEKAFKRTTDFALSVTK